VLICWQLSLPPTANLCKPLVLIVRDGAFVSDTVHTDGRDRIVGIVTHYRLDGPGIYSCVVRLFIPVQTGPGAHPASCTMDTGSLSGGGGVVQLGHGIDHPHPFSAKAKERVDLYLCTPSEPSWPVSGRTLPFTSHTAEIYIAQRKKHYSYNIPCNVMYCWCWHKHDNLNKIH
jgi:hypothetical protein